MSDSVTMGQEQPVTDFTEWQRLVKLIDLKDTLLVAKEFPCPRLLHSGSGLTLNLVQEWFGIYLSKSRSPLVCIRLGACPGYRLTDHLGWIGCWSLTLADKNGAKIYEESPAVLKLVQEFNADALRGSEEGTVILRAVCNHEHEYYDFDAKIKQLHARRQS